MATLDLTQFRAEDGSNTKRRIEGIYTGPAVYVAGGDAFTPGEAKLGQIDVILFEIAVNALLTTIYLLRWHKTTEKVVWYDLTGTEVVAGVDLSGQTTRFEAIGR